MLHTEKDTKHVDMLLDVFQSSGESLLEKLDAFSKYVPRQVYRNFWSVMKFLNRF